MKKFVLVAFFAVLGFVAAQAQVRLGGSVKVWYDNESEVTTYTLMPEFGYKLNDKWEVGTFIGFNGGALKDSNMKTAFSFAFKPFARYTFLRSGIFSMFCEGGIDIVAGNSRYISNGHKDFDNSTAFAIGFRPGIDIELSEHWSLESHLGFLGYSANEKGVFGAYNPGVGFSFANGTSLGLIYQF